MKRLRTILATIGWSIFLGIIATAIVILTAPTPLVFG